MGKPDKENVAKTVDILEYLLTYPTINNSEDQRSSMVNEPETGNCYTPLHHSCMMPPGSRIPGLILQAGGVHSLFKYGQGIDEEAWIPADKLRTAVIKEYLDSTAMGFACHGAEGSVGPMDIKYKVAICHDGIIPGESSISFSTHGPNLTANG